uniref:Uncharacterized protein n=1 Tax=Octopus bimaculoides TaxID=37653 RepID=A0A0L8IB40_OCTBM
MTLQGQKLAAVLTAADTKKKEFVLLCPESNRENPIKIAHMLHLINYYRVLFMLKNCIVLPKEYAHPVFELGLGFLLPPPNSSFAAQRTMLSPFRTSRQTRSHYPFIYAIHLQHHFSQYLEAACGVFCEIRQPLSSCSI